MCVLRVLLEQFKAEASLIITVATEPWHGYFVVSYDLFPVLTSGRYDILLEDGRRSEILVDRNPRCSVAYFFGIGSAPVVSPLPMACAG